MPRSPQSFRAACAGSLRAIPASDPDCWRTPSLEWTLAPWTGFPPKGYSAALPADKFCAPLLGLKILVPRLSAPQEDRPVVLAGSGRCGSTLLQSILNTNAD